MKRFLFLALALAAILSVAPAQDYDHGWINTKTTTAYTLHGADTASTVYPIVFPPGAPYYKGTILLKVVDADGSNDTIFKPRVGWRCADKLSPAGSYGDSVNGWFKLNGIDTLAANAVAATSFYWALPYDVTSYSPWGLHLQFQSFQARETVTVYIMGATY